MDWGAPVLGIGMDAVPACCWMRRLDEIVLVRGSVRGAGA